MDTHYSQMAAESIRMMAADITLAWTSPHVLLRPRVCLDGDKWCCLLGDDMMVGVVGFGDTPKAAAAAFDDAWRGILNNGQEK